MKNQSSNSSERTDRQKQRAYLFRDFSIRTKLIIVFLVMSIIPVVVIATRDTLQTQQALINGAKISLESNATQTANNVDSFIQNTLNSVGVEAQLVEFTNYLMASPSARTGIVVRERTLDLLVNLSKKDTLHIISYALVDFNGNVLMDSATDLQYNESGEAYLPQVQFNDKPIVTAVSYSEDETPILTFASKIKNANGEKVGILRVKFKASVLQNLIVQSVGVPANTSVILLDPLHIRMADIQNPELILKSIVPLVQVDYLIAVDTRRFMDIPREEQATNYLDFELALDNAVNQSFFRADITPKIAGDDTIAVAFLKTQPWIIAYGRPTSIFLADVQYQIRTNIILVLGISILITIITALIARSLTKPITALAKVVNLVEQGDLNARVQIRSRDEIGTLSDSFNRMTNQLQETLGNLEQRVIQRTAVAELARVEAESARKEIETQIWLTLGQSQLAEKMRGEQSIEMLANNVTSYLCQYLGAQSGGLFIVFDDRLVLTGRYAYVEHAGQKKEFGFGENLIGEAAKANRIINVDYIPADGPLIASALGTAMPRQLLIAPIEAEGQVIGVVELATLNQFSADAKHEAFLHRVSESIAIAFRTAQTRAQVDKLLVQSQRQTEELQTQEEELRAANEELLARAENLKAVRE